MSALVGQLEMFDDGLQPIGPECGRLLLRLLNLNGWRIHESTAFAGGVLLEAYNRRWPLPIQATGDSLAEAAVRLVENCNEVVPP